MYDNFYVYLTQILKGERIASYHHVCESCLGVTFSDEGDQSDPQNRIVSVEVEREHVDERCDYANGDKPEGCDDRAEDKDGDNVLDGRLVGHSTGSPACPAANGEGFCYIPTHNTTKGE